MKLTFLSLLTLTLAIPPVLPAATVYDTYLNGANEVPPTPSTAFGFALVALSGDTLMVTETFSGLIGGPAAAAHIHCCGPLGVNEPVALPFPGFPAGTAGTYIHSFDLTDATVYLAAFLTANGGTAAGAEAALVAALNSGQTYANIHNTQFPGGEIRGQLDPVPEPGTWLLAAASLLILPFLRRTANMKKH